MPLFFLIAIGAGVITVGAVTADVATDGGFHQWGDRTAAAVEGPTFNASAYSTRADCLNAAAQKGVSSSACPS